MKKYYAVKENDKKVTDIKVEVYYSLGGMNMFTYAKEKRGYYLSVSPVERSEGPGYSSEGFRAFTGTKWLLLEVKRKSAKAETEAINWAKTVMERCINYVLEKNGLELKEAFAA